MVATGTGAAAEREARVAGVLAGWLDREGLPEGAKRVMVVDDDDGGMERALKATGAEVRVWRRRATGGRKASAWPPEGLVDLAVLRLPRDWASFAMQVDAALGCLRAGGRLWVVGGNDEGIKSAPRRLAMQVETLWIKRRVRVLEALRPEAVELRGDLAAWRSEVPLELPHVGPRTLASYPGLFAHGRLDDGSRLLLEHLPPVRAGARVLDFGCGAGALSVAIAARQPDARLFMTDVDAVAVAAARENVPGALVLLGDAWSGVELGARFDLIVSNPPLHRGHAGDLQTLDALVQQAPLRLVSGGSLILVTWKNTGVIRKLSDVTRKTEVLAEAGPFIVLRGWVR